MYYLTVADVHGHMSDSTAALIEQEVTRLDRIQANRGSYGGLICRSTGQAHTEVCHYRENESGAVSTVGQAGTAVYIRVAYEL